MSISSLKTKTSDLVGKIKKKKREVLIWLGAVIVFGTFVVKEGLHESWQKHAEALDTAEYMYSLSDISSETNRNLALALERLQQLSGREPAPPKPGQPPKHPISGQDILDVATVESEITETNNSLSNTMIFVERLPGLHSMEEECEYYRHNASEAKGELMFLKNVYIPNAAYFLKKHKPWGYKPRRVDESARRFNPVDPGKKLTPFDIAVLDAETNFDLLYKDVHAFNKAVKDEALALRKHDEHDAKITWYISVGLFIAGALLALYGKLHDLPLGGSAE
jgi:hypothetical protein